MNAKITRALTTLAQMLADRGEAAPKLAALSPADIDDMISQSQQGMVRIDTGSRDVIVFVHKTKSSDLTRAGSETADQRLADVILVTPEPFKKIQSMTAVSIFGPHHESFTFADLSVNISRHTLVPKHEIVPKSEVGALKDACMVSSLSQLPLIESSDAMAKYIRARPGDVVRVVRCCPTSGTQVAYRYCRA